MPQENKKQPDKLPSRKRTKQRKPDILWHFESMDLVNRAMQGTNDIEQMMKDVLDTLLSVFECDRAFLVYPCDPEAVTWQVPMERTRPEYPGALPIGIEMPLTPPGAEVFRNLRAANGPVRFGPGLENEVDPDMRQYFRIQSYIAMALYPKIGNSWSFGLHQCSYARDWTTEEQRLFQEIGRRLADCLSILLALRNTQESERQIKQLIDASPVAMVVSSGIEQRVEWINEKFIELFGYTSEDIPDVEHWWPLAYPHEAYRAEIRARWETSVEQAIRERGHIQPMEATVCCRDGSQRHIEFRLSSIGEKNLVTFVDLTERKRVENALHERERHSQSLLRLSRRLEQAQTYSDVLDAAQDEVRDVTGYQNLWAYLFTPDKKQAKALFAKGPISDMVMSEDGTATLSIQGDGMMEEFVETKEILVVEDAQTDERTDKQIVARMGNRTLINVPILLFDQLMGSIGTGTFGDEGVRIPTASECEYLIAVASHMAVTLDRIRLLDEGKQSEQLFRALVENSPDFIARYDREYRRIYVNPAIQKLFGVSAENVLGKTPFDQSPVYAPPAYMDHLRQVIETVTESVTEMPYRTATGDMHWGHMRFVPEFGRDGKVDSVLAIGRDIHEIKENERRFQMLAENFPDLVMRFDRDGRYMYVNPAFETAFGMPAESIVGKTLQELPSRNITEQNDASLASVRRVFDEGIANEFESRWDTQTGERIFENRCVPEKDAAGNVVTVLFIARDLTERKQMMEALAEREREFRTLAEYSPDNIARYDINCRTIYVNPTLERTLGLPASEMLGTLPAEMGFIKEAKEYQEKMVEVLKTGKETEMNLVLPDMGEGVRYHNIRFVAERGADGEITGIQAIGRDLTEHKQIQDALWRSSQMLKLVLDNMPMYVFWKDRNSVYLGCNNLFAANAGLDSPEKLIGVTDLDLPWKLTEAESYRADDRMVMESGLPKLNYEETQLTAEGRIMAVRVSKIPLRDPMGEVIGVLGTFEDITERKRTEAALQESEERLRQITSSLREVVWLRDAQTRQVLYVNPAFEEITGRTCKSFYENRDLLRDAIHPDDRKDVTKALEKRSQSLPFETEHRIIHLNGSVRWVSSKSFAVRNQAGAVYRWASVMEDITERKLAEAALRESEERYRLLHENAGVGIGYYTPDGKIISYNQLAASHMQGKPEDFEGKSIYEVFPREEAEFYMGRIRKSLESDSTLEYEDHLELPSGEKWFLSIFTKINDAQQNVTGVQIISQDITEQKQAEESLRESERRLVAAQHMAHVGYWERDFDANHVTLSDEACRIFGIPEQGLSLNLDEWHTRWVALLHPEDQTRLIKLLGDVLAGIRSYDVEYRVIRPDGAVRFIYSQADVKRDAAGNAHNMLGMMQDITERKQAEQALRASENRFRVLSENAFVGIYIIQDGRLSYVNSTLAKIFGYTAEELTGAEPALVIHPDDQAMVAENIRRRIDGEIETIHYEFRGRCKDGEIKNIEVLGGRIDFGGKTAVIGNLMDITDRKRAEEQIRKLNQDLEQRVEERTAQLQAANHELEAFAYSVSHDLRAPLRHIDGFVELLQKKTIGILDEKGQHYMDMIAESARQMGKLIDDLLSFSRMGRSEMSTGHVDLGELLEEVLHQLEPETESRNVEWKIAALPWVRGDRSMLKIVFTNLISNALKFTRSRERPRIEIGSIPDANEVVIFTRDNGVGFDIKYGDKLFGVFQRLHRQEEFEGTGIGLANVHRIIHRHGGRTWAEGEIDHGATFYFSLPITK